MDYSRVKHSKISDVVMEQISNMILEGVLKPGEKLPSERELAEQFEISRPSLRGALHKLEACGLLKRVQGGGTYVSSNIGSSFTEPLLPLFEQRPESKYDLLEFRHALEETACYLAAQRATATDKETIQQRYNEWLALHNENKGQAYEAEADLEFHLSIAEASHNVVLPHVMRVLSRTILHSITASLKDLYVTNNGREQMSLQHEAMLNAILTGNPDQAKEAVGNHLNFVRNRLEEVEKQALRDQRALRRKAGAENKRNKS